MRVVITATYRKHEAFGYVVWRPEGRPAVTGRLASTTILSNGREDENGRYKRTYTFWAQKVILDDETVVYVPLSNPRPVV